MAGLLGQRAVLAPAGHAGVDEPRVPGHALVGSDPEPLGDTGAVRLDQDVGALDETEHRVASSGGLEIEGDVAPATPERVTGRRRLRLLPIDAHHRRAEVGQQRRRERRGALGPELDDLQSVERAAAHRRASAGPPPPLFGGDSTSSTRSASSIRSRSSGSARSSPVSSVMRATR